MPSSPSGPPNGAGARPNWRDWRYKHVSKPIRKVTIPMNRLLRLAGLSALAIWALMTPTSARQWNPDARSIAGDYTLILHPKGTMQFVAVWWAVPEAFAGTPLAQSMQDALSRYVVIGIADGRPGSGGQMSFTPIPDLKIADATGRQLSPLAANATPPGVTQAIATLQGLARQSLGPLERGIRWLVFDGSTIHSCQPGKLSVPYGGEIYTYDTPIPGCAKP